MSTLHLSTGWSYQTSRLQTLQHSYLQSHLTPKGSSYSTRRLISKSSVTAIRTSSAKWSAQFVTKPSHRPLSCASPGTLSVASVSLGWPYAPYMFPASHRHTKPECAEYSDYDFLPVSEQAWMLPCQNAAQRDRRPPQALWIRLDQMSCHSPGRQTLCMAGH